MPRLSFSGFDRADEAKARALFEGLALPGWSASDEASADAVLIDLDSMYGQMAWMKGLEAGKVSIGLTAALRADTAYRLPSPLSPDEFANVLRDLESGLVAAAGAAASPRHIPAATTPTAEPVAAPAPAGLRTTHEAPAAAVSSRESRLAARLARSGRGAFAIRADGLPRLVVDLDRQQFAPGKSLKALLGYATADLPADALTPIDATDAPAMLQGAGDTQPLARLVWLLALGGGEGRVQGHGPETRFVLGKWPQAEREFPKHFRIATIMLKGPATLAEIVATSGASEAEVADYINAALAAGHATAS